MFIDRQVDYMLGVSQNIVNLFISKFKYTELEKSKELFKLLTVVMIIFSLIITSCTITTINTIEKYYFKNSPGTYKFLSDSVFYHEWRDGLLTGQVYGTYSKINKKVHFYPGFVTDFEKNTMEFAFSKSDQDFLYVYDVDSVPLSVTITLKRNKDEILQVTDNFGILEIPKWCDAIIIDDPYHTLFECKIVESDSSLIYKVYLGHKDQFYDTLTYNQGYSIHISEMISQ